MRDEAGRPHLFRMLVEHDNPEMRLIALQSLLNHPTAERLPSLNKLLDDTNDDVREQAEAVSRQLDELRSMPLPMYSL